MSAKFGGRPRRYAPEVLTKNEAAQVEAANGSGKPTVVFIHGLWLLAGSWDAWREKFESAGYATVAADWPDDPASVEEARANPRVFAGKSIKQVADHMDEVVRALTRQTRRRGPLVRWADDANPGRPRPFGSFRGD